MDNHSKVKNSEAKPSFEKRRRLFMRKLKLALPSACLLCFTFLFFGPFEMVALNTSSFSYHYSDIVLPLLLAASGTTVFLTLFIALLHGKLLHAALSAVFSTAVNIYLQAAFFNHTLTTLTGDAVDWAAQKPQMLLNLAIWLIVYVFVFALMLLRKKTFRSMIVYVSVLLLFVQTVPVVLIPLGVYEGTQKKENSSYALQNTGLYEFSENHNVLVFVLDRLDYSFIERSLALKPDFLDFLDGFTLYDNATSVYNRTNPGLSHLLTGDTTLAYSTDLENFYSQSWHNDGRSILEDIHAQDYTIELYAQINDLFSKPQIDAQHVLNLSDGREKPLPLNIVKRMIMLSCYRFLPIAAKPYFFKDTNYYNSDVYAGELYELNDGKNGAGFADIQASRTKNSFKFIHFNGSHAPYYLSASGTSCDDPTSLEEQTLGCFSLLKLAHDRMKQLDLYEGASIIITADHGHAFDERTGLPQAPRASILYKPAGHAHTPLKISSAPVSTKNISATILKSMGADYSAYGPSLDEVPEDASPTRIHYICSHEKNANDMHDLEIYHIVGSASDMNNWIKVDSYEIPPAYRPY